MPTPTILKPNGQPEQTPQLPPKPIIEAALAECVLIVTRKQEILEGIALFHSGATDLLSTAAELDKAGIFGAALTNVGLAVDKICKAQGGILMHEIEQLTSRQEEMQAALKQYDSRITR